MVAALHTKSKKQASSLLAPARNQQGANMKRRTFIASAVIAGTPLALVALTSLFVPTSVGAETPSLAEEEMTGTTLQTGYAPVNGLRMYYEILGAGGSPLVVLHGAYGTIESTGALAPALAATRRAVVPEQQGHGRTADVDRPLSYEQMADDTTTLLRYLGIGRADLFGYSMGGRTALQFALQHPDLVRKLVLVAASYDKTGLYPEALAAMEGLTPERLASTPIEVAYRQVAPDPDGFPSLVAKLKQLDLGFAGFPPEAIVAIAAPTLIVVGDGDVVRPEHAVELFRLRGGGVPSGIVGPPTSRLAVLPGTTHFTLLDRTEWLVSMTTEFLDAPL